jgi:hypothetical protein
MSYEVYVALSVIMKTGLEAVLSFIESGHDSTIVMAQVIKLTGSGMIAAKTTEQFRFLHNRHPENGDILFFDFTEDHVEGMKWIVNEMKETAIDMLPEFKEKNDEKGISECEDMIEMTNKVLECFENQS